jgi:hypothetical protein
LIPASSERRSHTRNTFTTTIEYTLTPKNLPEEKTAKGITVNISLEGLCLYFFSPMREGQEIRIMKGIFPADSKTATVR